MNVASGLTIVQAAKHCSISEQLIAKGIREGTIHAHRISEKLWLIPEEEVERLARLHPLEVAW